MRRSGSLFFPLLVFAAGLLVASTGRTAVSPDADAVQRFADGTVSNALRQARAPGGVFVVVGGGRVTGMHAFGVSDVAAGGAVSAEETLFRVASISKILTSALVLERVETGELDLHADVNDWLGAFRLQPAFGVPVTLHDLLTHSAGFDVSRQNYAARTAADRLELADYLEEERPDRLRPPGQVSSYSNYGFALAGYLVERGGGVPFAKAMKRGLLDPLGMAHSSFSPDPAQRRRLATGYQMEDGVRTSRRADYVNITPAAGLCSTAADMSRLLLALTTNRRPDGGQAFPPDVLAEMTTEQFSVDPSVPGRAYGFNLVSIAGRPALRQTGQWPGFNSVLILFPGTDCGVFLAYNLCDELNAGEHIASAFARRFIPEPIHEPRPNAAIADTAAFLGTFQSIRYPRHTVFLGDAPEIEVTRSKDGILKLNDMEYRGIGGAVFERVQGLEETSPRPGRRVVFREPGHGSTMQLVTERGTYRRAPWWNTAEFRRIRSRSVAAILVSGLVLFPLMATVRFMGARVPVARPGDRLARVATVFAVGFCLLGLAFQAAFAIAANRLEPFALFYGVPASIADVAVLAPVILVSTVGLLGLTVLVWRARCWSVLRRVHFSLVAIAALLLCFELFRRDLFSAL